MTGLSASTLFEEYCVLSSALISNMSSAPEHMGNSEKIYELTVESLEIMGKREILRKAIILELDAQEKELSELRAKP